MTDLQVNWIRNQSGTWYDLYNIDLSSYHFENLSGVYIIWQRGTPGECVRVGKGNIRDRLDQNWNDPLINAYKARDLSVTWASIASNQQDGVEAYLGNCYQPLVELNGSRM